MAELIVLQLFDNPVFQNELLFLLGIIILFGLIGLLGRSETVALFGCFLAFEHIVTAVGSNVPVLNTANWAILIILAVYMVWQLIGTATGEAAGG